MKIYVALFPSYECGSLECIHPVGLDKFAHLALRTVAMQPLSDLLGFRTKLGSDFYPYADNNVLKGCASDGK